MRSLALLVLLAGCSAPEWPQNLTAGAVKLRIQSGDRVAQVFRGADGTWRESAPNHGEADPRAIDSLLMVLAHPQFRSGPERSGAKGSIRISVQVASPSGSHTVQIEDAPLGQALPVVLDGKARFLAEPLELSTKIPDPDGYVAPALWMSEEHHEKSLVVSGRANYRLDLVARDTWRATPPAHGPHDIEDFAGVITGREVVRFLPPTPPEQLGLDHPALTVELCTDDHGCRTFRFGEKIEKGVAHAYAQAPEEDLAELRSEDWKMLLDGP